MPLDSANPEPTGSAATSAAPAERPSGLVAIDAPFAHGAPAGKFSPGNGESEWFQDCAEGPRMVVLPAGSFMMGSQPDEAHWRGYDGREEPMHRVEIGRPFAAGATPVTRGEFAAFVAATGHPIEPGAWAWQGRRWWAFNLDKNWRFDLTRSWSDPGYAQDDGHPAVCVSWYDAQAYCQWLSAATGKRYRLLSEAEWEYCCRAGTTTPFATGATITRNQANFGSNGKATTPVRSFAPNRWGLYDMHGNIWEWCEDDWHPDYTGNPPTDGSAWRDGDHALRGLRGGCWDFGRLHFRSADRGRGPRDLRNYIVGFRVAREL